MGSTEKFMHSIITTQYGIHDVILELVNTFHLDKFLFSKRYTIVFIKQHQYHVLIYLSNIPLVSIVDFRSKEEIERGPDKVPASVKEDYALSISPGNLLAAASLDKLTVQQADSAMKDINRLLVTDVESIKQYKTMFDLLQNNDNVPLMFHCSAGKDRTGMGAALILSALGVGEDIIFANYMESNKYLADKYAKYIAEKPQLKPLFEVKPEFLKAGLDQIKKDHGSVENYLANVLMVDISKMRDIYLY